MLYGSASVDPSHALGEVVTGCQVGGRLLLMIVDGCLQGQKTAEMLSGGPRAGSGCCAPVDEEDHRIAGSTLDDCRQLLARQSWLRPISASEGRACPLAGRDDLQRPAARPAGQADKGHRKIAFLALATCSNVTRALTAAMHAALGKGDKGTAWSTRFAPRTAGR